jgi:hypothetical protein
MPLRRRSNKGPLYRCSKSFTWFEIAGWLMKSSLAWPQNEILRAGEN